MPEIQSETQPAARPKGPLALTIDATERCNLRCSYCYRGAAGNRCVDISAVLGTIKRLWPVIVEHGGTSVAFMGGEPLIALDKILQIAAELNERCATENLRFSWSMTSNLTLLTEKRAQRVLTAGGAFHCSVDGTPTSHDSNRPYANGRRSSGAVLKHVDILRQHGALRGARMTITPTTVGHFLEGLRYLHSLGFTSIAAFPAFDNQRWTPECLRTVEEQARLIGEARLKDLAGLTRLHPIDAYAQLLSSPLDDSGTHCGACHNFLGIDIHGRLYPCHRFTGLNDQSFEIQVLDGDGVGSWSQLQNVFRRTVPERCLSCPVLGACRGGCWAENLSATGTIEQAGQVSCDYNLAVYCGIQQSTFRGVTMSKGGSCTFCNPCIMCNICLMCNGCHSCDSCDDRCWSQSGLDDGCAAPAGST